GFKDITGEVFHGCKVLGYERTENRKAIWKCRCFCGEIFEAVGTYIRNGHKKSCGCLRRTVPAERNYRHGKTETRLYTTWRNMKSRCNNPNNSAYDRYGGRGIKICDEWEKNFKTFENWAHENGYKNYLTIERIDNDEGYKTRNCRWVNYYEQGKNKSNNELSYYKGKMRSRSEIAEMTGLSYGTIRRREESGID